MGPVRDCDRARWAEKIRERQEKACVPCKKALTDEDVSKIKNVSQRLKAMSGSAFGRKSTMLGYALRSLHKELDSILFGRQE